MINKKTTPILSIAIPTFNRSYFLKLNLGQLKNEIKSCPYGTIELLVSDNASEDDTQFTVEYFQNFSTFFMNSFLIILIVLV